MLPLRTAEPAENPIANRLLLSISEAERSLIRPYLEDFAFRQHAILHEPSQSFEFIYFPNSGLISLMVTTEDGKTVEAGMVGNEGAIGVAAAVGISLSPFRQIVQFPGDGFRIRTQILRRLLQRTPLLQLAMARYAVLCGMQTAQTAACNRLHDAGQRLARWLLTAADRVHANSMSLTHEFLAVILGTDRPSVSLAAQHLQSKGGIQYRRGTVQILSRKKLESSACECYRVIGQFNGVLRMKQLSDVGAAVHEREV